MGGVAVMSKMNLVDPNGYLEIADIWLVGQTITLNVTRDIYYIDFEVWWADGRHPIGLGVYLTDEDHHPVQPMIASAITTYETWQKTQRRVRTRFSFRHFTMEAGVEYFFLMRDKMSHFAVNSRIYIQKGDNIFPDGNLFYSDDYGDTWTSYPDDDWIFAICGTPELPPPPPNPPIMNFAILDLVQQLTETGIKLIVTTNVPCYLYCYWTATEPEKHLIPILTRGVEMHTRLKMCFVNWHENEQEEAGDTLIHTFIKEPWASCETRWLTFRAKVMGEWVKSVGPIFKKHRLYIPPLPQYEFPAVYWTGYMAKYGANWYDAWSDEAAAFYTGQWTYEVMARQPRVPVYTINRGILRFDTSEIPDDKEIQSATLKIAFHRNVYEANYGHICFVTAHGLGDRMEVGDYAALRQNTEQVCDWITIPPLELDTYYELDLYHVQLPIINKQGQTRIGIRASPDLFNFCPGDTTSVWVSFYGDFYEPLPNMDARLIVRWK